MRRQLKTLFRMVQAKMLGYQPGFPILRPIDTFGIEVLADQEFNDSCKNAGQFSCLDTPRLANLWNLSRMTDPAGGMIEIGSYRGGGALHISNANPKRRIIVCDSFKGFENLDPKMDRSFGYWMFKDTSAEAVDKLFAGRGRDYKILAGFFPAVCAEYKYDIGPISFVHMDVDAYKPTIDSLEYLEPHMLGRSLIVLDDFLRNAEGVMQAVSEFTAKHPSWAAFPLFPGQGVLVNNKWFSP